LSNAKRDVVLAEYVEEAVEAYDPAPPNEYPARDVVTLVMAYGGNSATGLATLAVRAVVPFRALSE
jgi:hypothetical protein